MDCDIQSPRLLGTSPSSAHLRSAGALMPFALIGALVLALSAGLYPIWRMNRLDAVRAVRTG